MKRELLWCALVLVVVGVFARAASTLGVEAPAASVCRDDVPQLSVRGIKLGMTREQIESRLGKGHQGQTARAFMYGDIYVRYADNRAIIVAGRQLERDGSVILAASESVRDADRVLKSPKIEGYMTTLRGPQPAVRYNAPGVTLLLVPGTATIGTMSITRENQVIPQGRTAQR